MLCILLIYCNTWLPNYIKGLLILNEMKNRIIYRDKKGEVLGLPLELLIILVVLALSLPLIYTYSNMYVTKQVETNVRNEVIRLKNEIEEVAKMSVGNQRVFSLKLEDHPLSKFKYLELGGSKSTHLKSIRYKIEGDSEKRVILDGCTASSQIDGRFREIKIYNLDQKLSIEKTFQSENNTVIISLMNGVEN